MLEYTDEDEQSAAARTVWLLCFEKSVRPKIRSEPHMIENLEKLESSPNSQVRKMANGALWTLKEEQHTKTITGN